MNDPVLPPAPVQRSGGELVVRCCNVAVWAIVTVLVTVLGIFLIPLTVAGDVIIPIAPVVAVLANLTLPRVMYWGTSWSWATFVPPVLWMVIAYQGASVTSGGDLLIPGNSFSSVVGLAYLGLGAVAAVGGVAIARRAPGRGGNSAGAAARR